MRVIKRVGNSTSRLTHGKEYGVRHGRITDDNGRPMRVCSEPRVMHRYWVHVETTTNESMEIKMLTITNVTLVNGTDATELNTERFLELIKQEEAKLEYLASFKVKSKAIEALAIKHGANIVTLVELLEQE